LVISDFVRKVEVESDSLPHVGPTSRLQLGMVEEESEEGCLYSWVVVVGVWDREKRGEGRGGEKRG
jgi:hypothetical protein